MCSSAVRGFSTPSKRCCLCVSDCGCVWQFWPYINSSISHRLPNAIWYNAFDYAHMVVFRATVPFILYAHRPLQFILQFLCFMLVLYIAFYPRHLLLPINRKAFYAFFMLPFQHKWKYLHRKECMCWIRPSKCINSCCRLPFSNWLSFNASGALSTFPSIHAVSCQVVSNLCWHPFHIRLNGMDNLDVPS